MATTKPRLDRRIVRSRNAILSAFERLLMEKPLADITVSAIAREANVDRKTFYVHFGTVDGLLDAIAVDVVEMIVDSVEKTLSSMGGDTNERALGAAASFFKTVNEALCNNLVLNRQLIENIPLDDFMARLRVPLEHEIAERDVRLLPGVFAVRYYRHLSHVGVVGRLGSHRARLGGRQRPDSQRPIQPGVSLRLGLLSATAFGHSFTEPR